jgi:hypothetical protein
MRRGCLGLGSTLIVMPRSSFMEEDNLWIVSNVIWPLLKLRKNHLGGTYTPAYYENDVDE